MTVKEDGWIIVDVVGTKKEKTIRDNIIVSDKVSLTNPKIIDLAETADKTNLELSKLELPRVGSRRPKRDDWLSD